MRIAYICLDPGVPLFGNKGCSIHAQEVIRGFRRNGHDVEVFAIRVGGLAPTDLQDLQIYELPLPPSVSPETREEALLEVNRRLATRLADAGAFDMVYERHALFSDMAMRFASNAGVPGVLEVNAPLIDEQCRHRELVHQVEAREQAESAFSWASLVICVSDLVAGYVSRLARRSDHVNVVPNAVDPDRFTDSVPPLRSSDGGFRVGFVGTLKPWHGVETLLEATSRARQRGLPIHLLIIGDGPQRKHLTARTRELGLSKVVEFTGSVAHDEVPRWLTSMDVAVAPYPNLPEFYFSPLKLFEYMAAGRAIVASDSCGNRQLIDHGVNGLLYKPGDIEGLACQLLCLGREPELRRRLGRAAREAAQERYSWTATVRRIVDLSRMDISAYDEGAVA